MPRPEPADHPQSGADRRPLAAGQLPWRAIWFAAAMLFGAGLAHLAMPHIFRAMPLSNMRVETVLDALGQKDLKPEIVVFGSSITAASVHDTTLSRGLAGKPLVVNLATPLQGLAESYLLYQELAPSTRVVIQQMTPWELVDREAFGGNKFNAYRFFGYRPNAHTVATLSEIFGEKTALMLNASDASQTFRQRWVVSRLLDVAFWMNLRTTLYLDSLGRDVFFYANNNFRLPEDLVRFLIRQWEAGLSDPDPIAFERKRKLVRIALADFRQAGRRMVFYVPPIHPDIRNNTSPKVWSWFAEMLDDARGAGAVVVDLRDTVEENEFRDALHVKLDATERVTPRLAEGIVAAGLYAAPPKPGT